MKKIRAILIFTLLMYFSIGVATSPPPPPFHQYYITGNIERTSNGNKSNYIVSLVGKFYTINADSIVEIKGRFLSSKNEIKNYITDSTGHFSILISSYEKADSLALKVSAPDKNDVIGNFFSVKEPSQTYTQKFTEPRSGCECEHMTEAEQTTLVDYYRYDFHNRIVIIP